MILRNLLTAASMLVATARPACPDAGNWRARFPIRPSRLPMARRLTLGDLRGEVVVLTYWMTDCGVCAEQLRVPWTIIIASAADVGLRVIAILDRRNVEPGSSDGAFKDKRVHPSVADRGSVRRSRASSHDLCDRSHRKAPLRVLGTARHRTAEPDPRAPDPRAAALGLERGDARQRAAFHPFEEGSAGGRDEGEIAARRRHG